MNMNEELILKAFPEEQYLEKMIQNDPSSIERIILKYLKDCLHGSLRVEKYNVEHVYIPMLLKQIEIIKKENDIL